MKNYGYQKPEFQETITDNYPAEAETAAPPVEATFARAAYEWNNALLLAAERMWGKRDG